MRRRVVEPSPIDRAGMKLFKPSRGGCYVMRWPVNRTTRQWDLDGGAWRQETTSTADHQVAVEIATAKARELVARLTRDRLGWPEFCHTYEAEHLAALGAKSRECWRTTRRSIARIVDPAAVQDLDAIAVVRWQSAMRGAGLADASVSAYSRALRAALRWAARMNLITEAPDVRAMAAEAGGRPPTGEEYERILETVRRIRPRDTEHWIRFLGGLWWSGLRLSELARLSWDLGSPITLDTSETYPVIRFSAKSQKRRKRDVLPVLPEFWDLASEVGPRRGLVFLIPTDHGQMSTKRIGRLLSKMGRRAGVVTKPETGKCCSAHDLRRAFADRLQRLVPPAELQTWMRHSDSRTTADYYLQSDAQRLAARLWDGRQ